VKPSGPPFEKNGLLKCRSHEILLSMMRTDWNGWTLVGGCLFWSDNGNVRRTPFSAHGRF
jgi:hypothetical protein